MNAKTTSHKLTFVVQQGIFAVCRLDGDAPIPAWALTGTIFSITRTSDELSIVCQQDLVPDDVRGEYGWRCLRVAGTMEFTLVGIVASLSTPLAEAGVGIFVISTFDTDYLLVRENEFHNAVAALRATGHTVDL